MRGKKREWEEGEGKVREGMGGRREGKGEEVMGGERKGGGRGKK